MKRPSTIGFLAAALSICTHASALAGQCGNSVVGFESWKAGLVQEASARGISPKALDALARTHYATRTIAADRNQKSFKLSLENFMRKRGADVIGAKGKRIKKQHTALFSNLERRFGVPAGPLIAIWGMETQFGRSMGKHNILSAITTLAYDCRRSDFFIDHLYAALALVERGMLNASALGAPHGEIGHTQFLPGNALKYAVDGDGDGRVDIIGSAGDALATTANFLQAHGWTAGLGYQPGEPNFTALQAWNAASVYQKAIALLAHEIDK